MLKWFVNNILNSATKIVLLMLTFSLCVYLWLWIVSEETFKWALYFVFWYYFGAKWTWVAKDLYNASKDDKESI